MVIELDHQTLGKVKVMGMPVTFSETPGKVHSAPPVLDQHGEKIRKEFS